MRRSSILLVAVAVLAAACGSGTTTTTGGPTTSAAGTATTTAAPTTTEPTPKVLNIISHDSFASGVTTDTFKAFTEETGIDVTVLPAGDAGQMVNQAILTKAHPLADVLFGVDDTFLSRALDAGIFEPYTSPLLDKVPAALQLDSQHRVTPIDFGNVCLNYDKAAFTSLAPPATLEDLTKPAYDGMLVVENPATSSTGLAFLLATIAKFGDNGWQDFWKKLVVNHVAVTPTWDAAYYTNFTRYGGKQPIVVSYASSPPAEVIFSNPKLTEAPTAVVTDGCYRQIEFAGVLAGTKYPKAAEKLVDYMLSRPFQETIPLTWFVYPANSEATLPPEFVKYTVPPKDPVTMDPAKIEANRERWINEWTQIVAP